MCNLAVYLCCNRLTSGTELGVGSVRRWSVNHSSAMSTVALYSVAHYHDPSNSQTNQKETLKVVVVAAAVAVVVVIDAHTSC